MRASAPYRRISRFALVGLASTLLYAGLAFGFAQALDGVSMTGASLLAYAIAALFSYCGHKYLTFVSVGAHRIELPRFLALTTAGVVVVTLLPAVLSDGLGLSPAAPILLACIVIPVVNYVVLQGWVFREP